MNNVQKFLIIANYYKVFVISYVKIEKLKMELRKEQEKVFGELKKRFIEEPVWVTSNFYKKLRTEADISDFIILNRSPNFVAGLMKKLNEILDIKKKLYIAFYP